MEDEDELKRLLTIIKRLKEENKKLEKEAEKPKGVGAYVEKAMYYANVPRDPFSHQFQLLNQPPREIKKMEDLMDAEILLGTVEDSKTLLLFQRDFYYLCRFFDMGTRSKGIKSLFNTLYYPWKGQVRMTATLSGRERDLQSFLEPETISKGYQFPVFGKKKQRKTKKRPVDYLTPEQEPGLYD